MDTDRAGYIISSVACQFACEKSSITLRYIQMSFEIMSHWLEPCITIGKIFILLIIIEYATVDKKIPTTPDHRHVGNICYRTGYPIWS